MKTKKQIRKWYFTKNSALIAHPVNKTFEEILAQSEQEFRDWVSELRQVVVTLWDNDGQPPIAGFDEDEILTQINKLKNTTTDSFLVNDLLARTELDVIRRTDDTGSVVSQWFPTMMKTKINYSSDITKGKSIYDYFKEDDLFESMIKYCRRHFKKDSFRNYSKGVPKQATDLKEYLYCCRTGREWIKNFEKNRPLHSEFDYWLKPILKEKPYSGNNPEAIKSKPLLIDSNDLQILPIPKLCKINIAPGTEAKRYQIMLYKKGRKLFPAGFRAFRQSYCQAPANFPPLTAKFLYERYMNKLGIKEAIIWDPSAGWGGRILGAMSVRDDFRVKYIGTDPNTDHTTESNRTKYHEIADLHNMIAMGEYPGFTKLKFLLPKKRNQYEIFQCGSEQMHKQPKFKKYKGKVDIVFTSPPYFSKELYSEDEGQSARKFSAYSDWRDGFLKQTLTTAAEWLKPGGYLLWNIADAKFGNELLPLESDSCAILESLGLRKVEILKMALATAPGGNRVDHDAGEEFEVLEHDNFGSKPVRKRQGKATTKNSCKVIGATGNELRLKYEPIFVYQKPPLHKSARVTVDAPWLSKSRAKANLIRRLEKDYLEALNDSQINPNRIRAIYAALKRQRGDYELTDAQNLYNIGVLNDNRTLKVVEYFAAGARIGLPVFVHPKFTNRSGKNEVQRSLVGKNILIRVPDLDSSRSTTAIFCWGMVLEREPVETGILWVKIADEAKFAEALHGLTICINHPQVLKSEAEMTELNDVIGDWLY